MSQYRLIRTTGAMVPGGYVFHDPITGKRYTDMSTLFDARVRQIINDRKANARLFTDAKYTDPTYVAQILSEQNCSRLKNNKLFCWDGITKVNHSAPVEHYAPAPAPAGKVCRFCGSNRLEEILCRTCSGKRITGYRCLACHKENSR